MPRYFRFTSSVVVISFFKFLVFGILGFTALANSTFSELAWSYVWTFLTTILILRCCCSDSPGSSSYIQIQEKALYSPPSPTPTSQTQVLSRNNYPYAPLLSEDDFSETKPHITPVTIFSGSALHEHVEQLRGYRYTYNHNLREADYARIESKSVLGNFQCTYRYCPSYPNGREWQSGVICVQVFLAPGDQYKTLIYTQKCSRCNQYIQPNVYPDVYTKRIVGTLDLWTGRRQRQEPSTDFVKTNPHLSSRCHGCLNYLRFYATKSGGHKKLPISRPPAKLTSGNEFDGGYLHAAVAREAGNYKYKQDLTQATEVIHDGSRSTFGRFSCHKPHPRSWSSGKICIEIFLASDDRYRTILHAQQCRGCGVYVKPEIDEESYAKKVVGALELWTGRRERQEPSDFKRTPPHDRKRCHGCQIGVCSEASPDESGTA
ncbi:hypothetical protein BGW39_001752 [Mortierella sp. 14UC]|nr:hypothetical protein BGW39_001752 [Mortierella sp. 14UC]